MPASVTAFSFADADNVGVGGVSASTSLPLSLIEGDEGSLIFDLLSLGATLLTAAFLAVASSNDDDTSRAVGADAARICVVLGEVDAYIQGSMPGKGTLLFCPTSLSSVGLYELLGGHTIRSPCQELSAPKLPGRFTAFVVLIVTYLLHILCVASVEFYLVASFWMHSTLWWNAGDLCEHVVFLRGVYRGGRIC